MNRFFNNPHLMQASFEERQRTFDRLGRFLSGRHDPADFALRLLHKDVGLGVGLGREVGVPMQLANMAFEELTEAMNRGWGTRNSTVGQLLHVERSGIEPPAVDPDRGAGDPRRRQTEVARVRGAAFCRNRTRVCSSTR